LKLAALRDGAYGGKARDLVEVSGKKELRDGGKEGRREGGKESRKARAIEKEGRREENRIVKMRSLQTLVRHGLPSIL